METTQMTQAIGGVRTGIGAALIVMPGLAGRVWVGPGGTTPAAKVLARAVGARDVVLGLRTLEAAGDRERAALWLHLGVLADAADVAGAVLAWRNLTPLRRLAVPLVAGAVGVAGYQAWRSVKGGAEPSTGELFGEDLAEPTATGAAGADGSGGAPAARTGHDGNGSASPAGRGLEEARILDLDQAAAKLGTPPEQVEAMVEEGMLEPESRDPLTFRASAVEAAHLTGG